MHASPHSVSGDPARCLDYLREADRLLDSAPRTRRAELAEATSDSVAMGAAVGGVAAAAIIAATEAGRSATPGAARELGEAVALLRNAAHELGSHPAGDHIQLNTTRWEHSPVERAAPQLAMMVRDVYPKLRTEFGLFDAPALTNWNVNDAEDDAALNAAGLNPKKKAIKIAIVVLIFVAFYVVLFSL